MASSEGMGDTSDDLAYLYGESEIGPLAFVGDAVVVRTTDGDLAFDLSTGDARAPSADETIPGDPLPDTGEARVSPDGRWRIVQGRDPADVLVPVGGGDEVVPDPGTDQWTLGFWSDEYTAFGTALDGRGSLARPAPGDTRTLLSCVVPSGECTVHDESSGKDVVFPRRAGSVRGLLLSGRPS